MQSTPAAAAALDRGRAMWFSMVAMPHLWSIALATYERFEAHDGWAIASHVALTMLFSLFPFLILVTALASFVGTVDVATELVDLAFEGWPSTVAEPIAAEVISVLTGRRSDLITLGLLLTVWIASSAVEAMRTALVRAYGVVDQRRWWVTRAQSLFFVGVGAVGMLLVSVGVVLWPGIWRYVTGTAPWLSPFGWTADLVRFGAVGSFLVAGLVGAHLLLPFGRRSLKRILPGVGMTLLLWLAFAVLFGAWLSQFANYASTYAGLGSVMAAIFFLQMNAVVFVLGCELNAELADRRAARAELRGSPRE